MEKQKLKEAYGVEGLSFYYKKRQYHCVLSPKEDKLSLVDLDFLLKALCVQQAYVFFDDVNEMCIGIKQLKSKYLIFRLAGLV